MGIEPAGVAIFAVRSSAPGGVGGDTDDAGDVDVVDSLEERGFVAREADPTDRRATQVALTASGRKVLEELDTARRADHESYFADLSERDRATLARILTGLVEEA